MITEPKGKPGRPPKHPSEGAQKRYTVTLTPVQVKRALSLGATVNQGLNNALRELCPDIR